MKKLAIILLAAFCCVSATAQIDSLKSEIENIIKGKKATVGVSIIANDFKDRININETFHYPMQSVFKFPVALAVLSEIDKGNFKLNQEIEISPKDLLPDTWSPIRDTFPDGTTMTIDEIIQYTIAQSDNNGCDILLRLIGGTARVEKFLQEHQLFDIAIKVNEEEQHKARDIQFQNWATPTALNDLLVNFYQNQGKLLSDESCDFLWKVMVETSTGANRLKGQLPQGTIVAHKTGTSSAAINDIGILVLPNGNPVFISVLVAHSEEDEKTNEKIISDIAKMVWDYYAVAH